MTRRNEYRILTGMMAAIWIVNGLFCKVLNLVPRHRQIVARILGDSHASLLTVFIGMAETVMAAWIISGFTSRLNAIVQVSVIAIMNTIEIILAQDLLLWGRWNSMFALMLIVTILLNEFYLKPTSES